MKTTDVRDALTALRAALRPVPPPADLRERTLGQPAQPTG